MLRPAFEKIVMADPTASARPGPHAIPRRFRGTAEVRSPPHTPRPRPRSTNIEPSTNIFINYMPADFTEADLRAMCEPYGQISCSKIMINLETGQSKCFGFVRFCDLQSAQAAIHGLNGRPIGGKRLLVKYAESREKAAHASPMVYAKRLPISIDQNQMVALFARFGEIVEITPQVLDSVDPQFWRCMICYSTIEAATRAVAEMNNQIVLEGSRPIHVRFADQSRLSGSFTIRGGPLPVPSLIEDEDARHLLPSFFFV
jgi:RNA recognition motif-containing protein